MAPPVNCLASDSGEMDSNYELICSLKANDVISVHKYKSKRTGITVCIAEVEGPVVCGYFCLATETLDDDGLPHTLEHLIFLGSEKYPYKGVLDLLANRCLASGTNACTMDDATYYTVETVGSEGFLTLLPVYLDHVLYPTLEDSSYVTEVHHITGEGKDAGVVYCEMEGVVNVGECLVSMELRKSMYPGVCGYKSLIGGHPKNLRESTTNAKCVQFHKDYYRPDNFSLIIIGQVKAADVFKALQSFEEKVLSKGTLDSFTRPWQSPIEPLTKSITKDILYPNNSEDNGMVYIAWRAPLDRLDLLGCTLLLKYLTDTSASLLQKEFVEIDDSFASNVSYSVDDNAAPYVQLKFENVPKAKISQVAGRLMNTLQEISKKGDGIDMPRIGVVIQRYILKILSKLESKPHDTLADIMILDFLYGHSKEDLNTRLNEIEDLKKFKTKPLSYWVELLKKYFVEAPSVVINGIPSIEKDKELTQAERKRVDDQIKALGPEGLRKKDEVLKKAIQNNERPIPDEMLTSVPVPSTDSIQYHHIKSFTTDSTDQHPSFNINKLPYYTYLEHINTNFIYMHVVMDTSEVSLERRPYIQLFLESILESPILRDGKLVPYETVVAELEMDTISANTRIGVENMSRFSCGSYGNSAVLALQLEVAKYPKGVKWIKELLYKTQFAADRLKIIASKMINDVAQMKRKGLKVCQDLLLGLIYKKESNHYNVSMLRQQQFLTSMLERLGTEAGQKEVLAEIESVRRVLTAAKNMVLYMAVNVDKLAAQCPDVYGPWNEFSDHSDNNKKKLYVVPDYELINPLSKIELKGCVTALGCIDTTFMLQCCPGIKDYLDPDLAPLLVCLQYLTQLEGPMWRNIRGKGFAYSYRISPKPNEGVTQLMFYRATNVVSAYNETKAIVNDILSKNNWDTLLFDSAKSSLIYKTLYDEMSIGDMVVKSLLNHFQKVPHDYTRHMVKSISEVTLDDVKRVAPLYLKPLFDPAICKTTIVCHPLKLADVANSFKEFNQDLKVYNSLEETYLNFW